MPYIPEKDRPRVETERPSVTGELNYILTREIVKYIQRKGKCYATCSEVRAALADCSSEFYRRIMGPYEDIKKIENGDVYDEIL